MKKFISLALALMLVMSLSVTAFAADNTSTELNDNKKSDTIAVTGTYKAGTAGGTVISVHVAWTDMSFTYNAESSGKWQPGTHTYGEGTEAGWSESKNSITVTNHSNVDVTATFAFAKDAAVTTELTGSFSTSTAGKTIDANGAVVLTAGEINKPTEADEVEAKMTLTGSLPADWEANKEIGKITVTIAKKTN